MLRLRFRDSNGNATASVSMTRASAPVSSQARFGQLGDGLEAMR